jgi:TolB-like protein
MSADPEQNYFADGLVEEIIAAHAEIGASADFKKRVHGG